MPRSIDYDQYLIESLKDPEEAAGYLNAALEDGNIEVFLSALKYVTLAQGGVSKLSQKTQKSRNSLYKTLSKKGNPYLGNTQEILKALGFSLSINIAR